MCGRFNITSDPMTQLIMEILEGQVINQSGEFNFETRYNIAPTESVPVLYLNQEGEAQLREMRWWLVPAWAKEPSTQYTMFNAKSETLAKSRAFQGPYKSKRCIVPASGYYEWQKQAKVKVPYYIEPEAEPGFAFAGLWEYWRRDNREIYSCTIVTAAAPQQMAEYHHRIPVQLSSEEARLWLSAETPRAELDVLTQGGIKGPLKVTPVSSYVGNARHKDERCIEPLGDPKIIH